MILNTRIVFFKLKNLKVKKYSQSVGSICCELHIILDIKSLTFHNDFYFVELVNCHVGAFQLDHTAMGSLLNLVCLAN